MPFPFRWLMDEPGSHRCEVASSSWPSSSHSSPPPGCCQTLVCYQERYLILFGGGSLHRFSNEVYVFDLTTRRWSRRQPENSDIVAPRLGHSAVIYGDAMLVYGGQDLHSPIIYDEVLQLDLLHWRWTLLQRAPPFPDGPGVRRLHSAHVVADTMYVVLGTPFCRDESPVWSLDLKSGQWRDMQPSFAPASKAPQRETMEDFVSDRDKTRRLCGCCTALLHNAIYVYGGYVVGVGEADAHYSSMTYAQTLYVYDVGRNTWRLLCPAPPSSPQPPRRYAAAMAVHNDTLFLFGGDANAEDRARYFNDVWRFRVGSSSRSNSGSSDSDSSNSCEVRGGSFVGRWEQLSVSGAGPSPRSGCAYATAQSCLYVVGGEVGLTDVLSTVLYSDQCFHLPLGYSTALTLRENAARWIGLPTRPPLATPFCADELCTARLPLGARQALMPYRSHPFR